MDDCDKAQKKYMLIACAVLARECYLAAAMAQPVVHVRLVDQGLHDIGKDGMSSALQAEIDQVDSTVYDAILLGYGLCNHGIEHLHAAVPMVVPRAHDCITLLMGSREDYDRHFHGNPGTFYHSVGWSEQAGRNMDNPQSTTRRMGMASYEDYVEKYGEENAAYLYEMLNDHLRHYSQLTWIDNGVPDPDQRIETSRELARERGWDFNVLKGSMRLLHALANGDWNPQAFLVLEPGERVQPTHDENIIRACRPDQRSKD